MHMLCFLGSANLPKFTSASLFSAIFNNQLLLKFNSAVTSGRTNQTR